MLSPDDIDRLVKLLTRLGSRMRLRALAIDMEPQFLTSLPWKWEKGCGTNLTIFSMVMGTWQFLVRQAAEETARNGGMKLFSILKAHGLGN